MVILVNSLFVEIYERGPDIHFPAGYWKSKAIRIYDPLETVTEEHQRKVIQYLYDEGFILDRRVDCDIITGEDCNG